MIEIEAIDAALVRHIEGLTEDFFQDVRTFNRMFARVADTENDEDE